MLLDTLKIDYKQAMKEKKAIEKQILSYVIAQIKNKQIDSPSELVDDDIIAILKKEIKSRKESIGFLEKSGNQDEINTELAKIEVIEKYLPQMLSYDELKKIILDTISKLGIENPKAQRGPVIGAIMKDYRAVVDGAMMNQIINEL